MKCPQCNVALVMGERLNTQIDYCPQCRGIWLEKGKLDSLLQSADNGSGDRKRRKDEGEDDGGFLGGLGNLLGGGD
jgi:Zn-finger nucleic acid-binding protein